MNFYLTFLDNRDFQSSEAVSIERKLSFEDYEPDLSDINDKNKNKK